MTNKLVAVLYTVLASALIVFVGCYVALLLATIFQGVISGFYISALVLRYVFAGVVATAVLCIMTKTKGYLVSLTAIALNLVVIGLDLNFFGGASPAHGNTVVLRHAVVAGSLVRVLVVVFLVAFGSFIASVVTTEVARRFKQGFEQRLR